MFNDATIIALAWPDTKVVHEGKWYDTPMRWFGILKDNHYSAGHAALLLINHRNNDVHYFDFGRYHTPLKYGRVRSAVTDPDNEVKIKAKIIKGELHNIDELLLDRYFNKACHGDGRLTASIVKNINFERAFAKISAMQHLEAICYGPFERNGSNCSRFVAQVVLASSTNYFTKLLIKVSYTVTATPRSNTKVLNDLPYYYEVVNGFIEKKKSKFYFLKKWFTDKDIHKFDNSLPFSKREHSNTDTKITSTGLIGTMIAPEFLHSIPKSSKWISGQGTGCWFCIEATSSDNLYRIIRFTPRGEIDCDRIFELIDNGFTFKINQSYKFVHLSHCQQCKIEQKGQLFVFQFQNK